MRAPKLISSLIILLALTSCLEEQNNPFGSGVPLAAHMDVASQEIAPQGLVARAPMSKSRVSDMVMDRSKLANRRIAETHSLNIQTAHDALQARFRRDYARCIALGCEILNSYVNRGQNGHLNARIAPENLGTFLDFIAEGEGELKSHNVQADDRTLQFIDNEERLKNLNALRDRLRVLLVSPKAEKVKDILEIEREITRVQSQIDSLTGQQRHLQNITGKATVRVDYTVPYRPVDITYHDVSNSFKYAWQGFLRNLSEVIKFTGRTLPWLPVFFIGLWITVRIFRFAFTRSMSFIKWPFKRREKEAKEDLPTELPEAFKKAEEDDGEKEEGGKKPYTEL